MIRRTLPFSDESFKAYAKEHSNQRGEAEWDPPMLAGDAASWVLQGNGKIYEGLGENISDHQPYRCFFKISYCFLLSFVDGTQLYETLVQIVFWRRHLWWVLPQKLRVTSLIFCYNDGRKCPLLIAKEEVLLQKDEGKRKMGLCQPNCLVSDGSIYKLVRGRMSDLLYILQSIRQF